MPNETTDTPTPDVVTGIAAPEVTGKVELDRGDLAAYIAAGRTQALEAQHADMVKTMNAMETDLTKRKKLVARLAKAQVADKASVGLKAKTDALVAAFKGLHPEIDVAVTLEYQSEGEDRDSLADEPPIVVRARLGIDRTSGGSYNSSSISWAQLKFPATEALTAAWRAHGKAAEAYDEHLLTMGQLNREISNASRQEQNARAGLTSVYLESTSAGQAMKEKLDAVITGQKQLTAVTEDTPQPDAGDTPPPESEA